MRSVFVTGAYGLLGSWLCRALLDAEARVYDVSKACADLVARSYWHTYGLPVAVTRFANLYGGGDGRQGCGS